MMKIAIDGPAAAGKGTLARALARHFGLRFLDTGSLYRAVALAALERGADPQDEAAMEQIARHLDLSDINDQQLRTAEVGQTASIVASLEGVRRALLDFQRDFAARPPGAVLDGRDIGTVVLPGADVKLYVTATPAARARRRADELRAAGHNISDEDVLAQVNARDARDSARAAAPLTRADDALLLDTTNLDIEAAFRAACRLIEGAT